MRTLCTQHHGLHSFHPVRNTSLPLPSVALEHAHAHTHTVHSCYVHGAPLPHRAATRAACCILALYLTRHRNRGREPTRARR